MPDKSRAWAGADCALKGLDAASVPPVRAWIAPPGVELVVDVHRHRQALLATKAEYAQGIRVIVHHAQLELAIETHAVHVDRCLQAVDRIWTPGIGGVAEHELVRAFSLVAQAVVERDRPLAAGEADPVIARVELAHRALPAQQPRPVDIVLGHVLQEATQVVLVPVRVIVGIDDHALSLMIGMLDSAYGAAWTQIGLDHAR